MSTLSVTISEEYTQRYEALLRATNAIGTCSDCDAAADMLVKTLLEVVPFDYLQLVAFESDTRTVAWHLLYANGAGITRSRQMLPRTALRLSGYTSPSRL